MRSFDERKSGVDAVVARVKEVRCYFLPFFVISDRILIYVLPINLSDFDSQFVALLDSLTIKPSLITGGGTGTYPFEASSGSPVPLLFITSQFLSRLSHKEFTMRFSRAPFCWGMLITPRTSMSMVRSGPLLASGNKASLCATP